jgi:hypothetical protein
MKSTKTPLIIGCTCESGEGPCPRWCDDCGVKQTSSGWEPCGGAYRGCFFDDSSWRYCGTFDYDVVFHCILGESRKSFGIISIVCVCRQVQLLDNFFCFVFAPPVEIVADSSARRMKRHVTVNESYDV